MESKLFPLVDMVLVFESKYGEAIISLEDMDGNRAQRVIVDFDEDDCVANANDRRITWCWYT